MDVAELIAILGVFVAVIIAFFAKLNKVSEKVVRLETIYELELAKRGMEYSLSKKETMKDSATEEVNK